eukprot:CAMPEP_0205813730 /NCGR_PEP_ID=MMETSP0205-20121125/18463_1 /ASSEMBLY_ACC=CAM_ASM_000278 /TAXON_ID=36767 /ORGANISM="Euplotes focardii, Strain TN1" /LENGTH=252 /DNA_ID=CAMNT_0053096259 /DNA_START=138 /DNA_END=896 /DNA_ORIENTATION=+
MMELQENNNSLISSKKQRITSLELQLKTENLTLKKTIFTLESRCNKYKKTSDALKLKAKNVLELSQKYMNSSFQNRENKIQTTETKCISPNSSISLPSPASSIKELSMCKIAVELSPNSGIINEDIGGVSEQIEFNAYDFTKSKQTPKEHNIEVNNTNDTAEFGEGDLVIEDIKQVDFCQSETEIVGSVPDENTSVVEVKDVVRIAPTETIYEEDEISSEKENIHDNFSSEKKSLHDHISDYFSRYGIDEEK